MPRPQSFKVGHRNVCKTNTHFVLFSSKGLTVLKCWKKDKKGRSIQYNGHLTSFAKLPPQLASFLRLSLHNGTTFFSEFASKNLQLCHFMRYFAFQCQFINL